MSNLIYIYEKKFDKHMDHDRDLLDQKLAKRIGKIKQQLHKIEQQLKDLRRETYEVKQ